MGTVLALLAFILAFTFGIVADRYDARKGLVREQASAIRNAYSRSDFLPEPQRDEAKVLYNDYIDLVIQAGDADNVDNLPALISEAQAIQGQLWDMAVENVRLGDNSDISAMYVESINEMSNVLANRIAMAVQARMPTGLWVVLYVLVGLGMVAVGYQTAIAASRQNLGDAALGAVVLDRDRPDRGPGQSRARLSPRFPTTVGRSPGLDGARRPNLSPTGLVGQPVGDHDGLRCEGTEDPMKESLARD